MKDIVLVDDDRNVLTSVTLLLEDEGFRVRGFSDGAAALQCALSDPPDLMLLDIKMPRLDGLEILKRLRQSSSVPVIFLTSRDDELDELLGLRMGADDYIRKPFSPRLLIARIRAVLRRHEEAGRSPAGDGVAQPLERGPLSMDPLRHTVSWRGEPLSLTLTEFLILQGLAIRPGFVKSRDQLMDAAYDSEVYVDDRTIDSHIKRLRKKFRQVDPDFTSIETLYGVGYRYVEA